jgi:hypothetical protein
VYVRLVPHPPIMEREAARFLPPSRIPARGRWRWSAVAASAAGTQEAGAETSDEQHSELRLK